MKKTAALLIDATAWGFTMCALWALLIPRTRPRVVYLIVDREQLREAAAASDIPATTEVFSKKRGTATG